MWFVYLIKSSEGLLYTGMTTDVFRRIQEHNSGISTWSSRGSNWELVYEETFKTANDARMREKYFKSTAGKEWLRRRNII